MDRNLRAFLAVARAGNITAAADRIGLSQPALTKTIRRIEAEFGTSLFRRTARGMLLTETGQMLLGRAEAVEMHYLQAQEEIRAHRAGTLAEFRIVAGAAYHSAIAPDLVKRLAAEFPSTLMQLTFDVSGSAMPRLAAGELDLLLGAGMAAPAEGIETLPLLSVEVAVWGCRDEPLTASRHVEPGALKGRGWVVYRRDRHTVGRIGAFCADHLLPEPRIVMEVDSLAGSFKVVKATPYLTAATTMAADLAEGAGLRKVPLGMPIWSFVSGAWFRRSQRHHPIMRSALAFLTEAAAAHAASV